MLRRLAALASVLALVALGCAESRVPPDDDDAGAARVDAAREDAALPGVCSWTTPPDVGPCDGMSQEACERWAESIAGGEYHDVRATCVLRAPSCAAASTCLDPLNPATCRCGEHPACAAGEVCARRFPTVALSCLPCGGSP